MKNFRAPIGWTTACLVAVCLTSSPARAAFHLWNITEIYTNASGTLQFIELSDTSGADNSFTNGMQINVSNVGNTQTNSFTLNSNTGSPSTGHHLLLGTAGIQAAGAPAPNYIFPSNFLFSAGGTINFFGANSGAYTALPTDGTLSRTWGDGNAVNSPQNFAGAVGTIVAPEPGTISLLCTAGLGVSALMSRRRRRR